jgi:hypothetical protein
MRCGFPHRDRRHKDGIDSLKKFRTRLRFSGSHRSRGRGSYGSNGEGDWSRQCPQRVDAKEGGRHTIHSLRI